MCPKALLEIKLASLLFKFTFQVNCVITAVYSRDSRRKGIVVLGSKVVGIQIKHSHHERHKNCYENHHELKDIFHCPSQGNLQRAKALIGRQDVCNARETQHNCNCIEAFRNKLWI